MRIRYPANRFDADPYPLRRYKCTVHEDNDPSLRQPERMTLGWSRLKAEAIDTIRNDFAPPSRLISFVEIGVGAYQPVTTKKAKLRIDRLRWPIAVLGDKNMWRASAAPRRAT